MELLPSISERFYRFNDDQGLNKIKYFFASRDSRLETRLSSRETRLLSFS